MSFINKVKNFFYEDVEEDDEEFEAREAAKREAKLRKEEEKRKKQEQTRMEKFQRQEKIEPAKPSNDNLSERELFKAEKTFNFPMDLGDDIFDETEIIPEVKEETRKEVKEEKNLYARPSKQTTVTSVRPSYTSEVDLGPKKFHPTPVVSPVYGILDKNYTVDDVVERTLSKTKEFSLEKKTVDFDSVRNKAYKELDDEIEKTMTGKKDIFYNLEEEKKDNIKDIKDVIDEYTEEEYDKNENEDDDVIITYEGTEDVKTPVVEEENEESDDIDLTPDVNITKKDDTVETIKKINSIKNDKKEIPEPEVDQEDEEVDEEKEDLFNLIDNMYSDEEDEEEE